MRPERSLPSALAERVVVLDGGLSTELERAGHDVSSALWSARLLRDDPAAVLAAHRAFLAAGAEVATTASYQATFEGFAAAGIARDEAATLLRRSVALARVAADELPHEAWVASSIGPYGAFLADGSEYTGDYAETMSVRRLADFHLPRLEAVVGAAPDILGCETIPAAAEAEALLVALDGLGVPAWMSLTVVIDASGEPRTRRGERASDVFAMCASQAAVVAVGVNCMDPVGVEPAVAAAARTGLPVVVYPNSGESWDPSRRTWYGESRVRAVDVARWVDAGARLVGGCCRIGPARLAEIARAVRGVNDAEQVTGGGT